MGLVNELRASKICIDTAPFIYFIEKDPKYLNIIRPLFAEIDAGKIDALVKSRKSSLFLIPVKTGIQYY